MVRVLHEAHKRQVEEKMDTLAEWLEGFDSLLAYALALQNLRHAVLLHTTRLSRFSETGANP